MRYFKRFIINLAVAVKSVNPRVQVISVESERAPGFYRSMKGIQHNFIIVQFLYHKIIILAGRPVVTECQSTLADGLAVPLVGANAYATAAPLVDKVVVVRLVLIKENNQNNLCIIFSEEFIAIAILRLVEMEKAVVEGIFSVFILFNFIS